MRSLKLWLPMLVVCLAILYWPETKEVSTPMPPYLGLPPMFAAAPQTNYVDIGLKIGAGLGGLGSLVNLIEKLVKFLRRK